LPNPAYGLAHNGMGPSRLPSGTLVVCNTAANGGSTTAALPGPQSQRRCSVGVLDRFEKGVERAVNSVFSKAFRSDLKPVEIASAIRRDMDERTAALSRGRTVVPNTFAVELSGKDFDQVQDWGEEAMAQEMVEAATEHADSQGYVFVGPVDVTFTQTEDLEPGQFRVHSSSRRGPVAPATSAGGASRHPILDIDGQRYLLTGPVTVIGRGSEADIIVDDAGVSRR